MTDIAVMAITFGGTLEQMTSLDLAYAPPFSTAIHPFTAAVQILLNKMNGVMDSFTPAEYMAGAADDYRIIDVNPAGPTIPGVTYVDLTAVDAQVLANPRGEIPGLGKMKSFCLYVQRVNVPTCFRTG